MPLDTALPRASTTDSKRLQQILKNLLSNAFKFMAQGHVDVKVQVATEGWTTGHRVLSRSGKVISFAISDTGIGIAPEKQRLIFALVSWSQRYWCVAKGVWRGVGGDGEVEKPRVRG